MGAEGVSVFDEDNYYTVEPKNQVEWTNLIGRDTVLSLVEILVLLHQLSYALKNQFKAPKASY